MVEEPIELFCFASESVRNILIGIERKMWAVPPPRSDQKMAEQITKAERLIPGSNGMLYCGETSEFTTPFRVMSEVELREVKDVWPETWWLPFTIEPLGSWETRLAAHEAAERWPFLQNRMLELDGAGGVTAALNITGTTVFVPTLIASADWSVVLADLGTKPIHATEFDIRETRERTG